MSLFKTVEEINHKIATGKAVVLTAEEIKQLAQNQKSSEIIKKVDVVTTATFSPMCSSGVFINFGHTNPPMRMEQVSLNGVPAYGGIAAVDAYLGATAESENPQYGGGHAIEDLIAGKKLTLKATGKGTDCYPRRETEREIDKSTVNEIIMFNPRNAYQNYGVALNSSKQTLHTYMGTLLPKFGNANYATSGEWSPLLNDPFLQTIGVGTRIFLGGAAGYITGLGTQANLTKERNVHGIPLSAAATLAVTGNARNMSSSFIKAAWFEKYGISLFVGIGIAIPLVNEEMAHRVCIRNKDIETQVYDYGKTEKPILGKTNYQELQSGTIVVNGKKVRTASLSSLAKAHEIMGLLKSWIENGKFALTQKLE